MRTRKGVPFNFSSRLSVENNSTAFVRRDGEPRKIPLITHTSVQISPCVLVPLLSPSYQWYGRNENNYKTSSFHPPTHCITFLIWAHNVCGYTHSVYSNKLSYFPFPSALSFYSDPPAANHNWYTEHLSNAFYANHSRIFYFCLYGNER